MLTRINPCVLVLVAVMFTGTSTTIPAPLPEDAKPEEKTKAYEVRKAIKAAVAFLTQQQKDGHWEEGSPPFGNRFKGGATALATLALLDAGLDPAQEPIRAALKYLRDSPSKDIYVLALQTAVFCRAHFKDDRKLIEQNTRLLVKAMLKNKKGEFTGFTYDLDGLGPGGNEAPADGSNTSYAVMALEAADEIGVCIADDEWKGIYDMYARTQLEKGGWGYRSDLARNDPRITMTCAGVAGMLAADRIRCRSEIQFGDKGESKPWNRPAKPSAMQRGIDWIAGNWTLKPKDGWMYYHLLGVTRLGEHYGSPYYGDKLRERNPIHWYEHGVDALLKSQSEDGYWGSLKSDIIDQNAILATSFAIEFLARGKSPVVLNKLVWGAAADRDLDGDWNAARHDARNLAEYCGNHLFRKDGQGVRLNRQFVNLKLPFVGGHPSALQTAPLLYIAGVNELLLTDNEKQVIAAYVKDGGFLLVNATDNDKEFDKSFRKLAKEIWPKEDLKEIDKNHPLWTASKDQAAKEGDLQATFRVEGITIDKRLAVVYVPQDLGLHWTANRLEGKENERIRRAFRLGANIVAYATGGKPPKEKLEK